MIGFQVRRMKNAAFVVAAFLGIGGTSAFGGELFPANGATSVCVDTPLRVGFDAVPMLSGKGTIVVSDADSKQVVETIDMGAASHTQAIGGVANFNYLPVTIEGKVATIHLKNGELGYGHRYTVMVDAGVFTGDTGVGAGTWGFGTKEKGPAEGTTKLTVAADGTGDFATVQGAIDFVPTGNKTPTTLFIRKGVYTELVCFVNKGSLSFVGEDRKGTVIQYPNNAKFNGGNDGHVYHRGLFLAAKCDNLVMTNLTLHNTTPQGGSQAEAIILNGTPTSQAIISGVDLYSYQDTLQINGQAYVKDCYIEGDVDFMWGNGPSFFEGCECKSLRSKAYYTQIRNPETNHGFVYYKCVFDGAAGITGNFLARIEPIRFAFSEVVLVDCTLTDAVGDAAWHLDGVKGASQDDLGKGAGKVRFWEFNSHTPEGKLVDVSHRLGISRQLAEPADEALISEYRDPVKVLGNGWDARKAEAAATQKGAGRGQ